MPKEPKPMTSADLPKGRRPEEFLTDDALVAYYERELEGATGKLRDDLAVKLSNARRAAATTASLLPSE